MVDVPASFDAYRRRGPSMAAWLDRLPTLVDELVEEWELTPDGAPVHGYCALVVPVRTAGGRPAVLKVTWPHPEAEHEHVALKTWAGRGAVELLRADPRRCALLLERLHPDGLVAEWDVAACEVVGSLYGRLHVPAPPQLRTLSSYVEGWTSELDALPRDAPLPHRMVRQAVSIGRSFAADPATDGVLVHGDLHYENVLAGDREPWLAIDPKPVSGDPHFEVAPLLWNRFDEVAGDVRRALRARFHAVVDAGGLDEDRARDWVVLRMMCNATWGLTNPTAGPHEEATHCVAVAKAVQD
ncbi:streptomycin 6-kinase [Marmoricola endophyticus]|uniref:Streptomycin 6-kinase n=1 Tax=Marmoricola endophyticus TaxID=2040280 RepID=A0A917F044_9ACTN|nr:aminoglycoside phosphotransferase family protein [Marmoricola endophyticus]GGF37217.1 streptomycin 6-kinase [Marmoricola endophyticus]